MVSGREVGCISPQATLDGSGFVDCGCCSGCYIVRLRRRRDFLRSKYLKHGGAK